MKTTQIIVSILFATLIISCSTKPSEVIEDKKMVEILKDMYKADAIFKNDTKRYETDEQKDELIASIFKKYDVTQKQFDVTLDWYAENLDDYNAVQDTVSKRLKQEAAIYSEQIRGKTVHRLFGFDEELPEYYTLTKENPTFSFKIDSTKLEKVSLDDYCFNFEILGVDTSQYRLEAALYFKYTDTTIINTQKIIEDNYYSFVKPNQPDSLLKAISGYIHLAKVKNKFPKVLLNNISNKKEADLNDLDI